jgi:hypothetical protein
MRLEKYSYIVGGTRRGGRNHVASIARHVFGLDLMSGTSAGGSASIWQWVGCPPSRRWEFKAYMIFKISLFFLESGLMHLDLLLFNKWPLCSALVATCTEMHMDNSEADPIRHRAPRTASGKFP